MFPDGKSIDTLKDTKQEARKLSGFVFSLIIIEFW